jgi:DNA-binding transcriptional MocR family regulator
VWAVLPPSVEANKLASLARSEGVEYLPREWCFAQAPAIPGTYMRLSFSLLTEGQIEEAIKKLGSVIRTLL